MIKEIGEPMLVNLPEISDGVYQDTGEGGLAFFFVINQKKEFDDRRQVCIAEADNVEQPFISAVGWLRS